MLADVWIFLDIFRVIFFGCQLENGYLMGRIETDGITFVYADGTGGLQSIPDLLQNFGTFHAVIDPPSQGDIDGQIVLSGLYSEQYEFEVNINKGRFNFIRNGIIASQPLPKGTRRSIHFFARWDPESIDVVVLEQGYGALPPEKKPPFESFQSRPTTPFTVIPDQLIHWARAHYYLPTKGVSTTDEFFVELVNVVDQLQATIENTGAQRIFWDFKQGNESLPVPKAEPQVTTAIHLLLTDASVRKEFQIVPQAGAMGGSLDFQFNKALEGGNIAVAAMEAKHAHSSDIESGLITQLPAYMRAVSAPFGIYLVLWFKGKYFDQPAENDFEELRTRFLNIRPHAPSNVRIMHLNLSIPEPPSKR